MDSTATAAQVPPALRTKSKAYQTTIAAEAGPCPSSPPPSPPFVAQALMLWLHVDDLKYESKYKELRKKVKIVEEVRIHFISTTSAYFVLTAIAKCRTMTSYMLRFSKRSTTSNGCDSNERESPPSTRLLSYHSRNYPSRVRLPTAHRRYRAADLVLYPRVPRSAYAPLHAYGISISLKPSFGSFLCSIHIPFCSFFA